MPSLALYVAGAVNAFAAGWAAGRGDVYGFLAFSLVAGVIAAYDLRTRRR